MNFAEAYSRRYTVNPKIFNDNPRSDTGIIVVIPCYDDEFIFTTLSSLNAARRPSCSVEVIVVVNSAEDTPATIVEKNRRIFSQLKERTDNYANFVLQSYLLENVAHKIAGVGNARKVGMDEAVWRFAQLDKPNGIIVSLDADCLVSPNYFVLIEDKFRRGRKLPKACTFQFQHDFNEALYDTAEINACRRYELYLRYFRLAQKVSGIPNCLHTIGSCFAVTAEAYAAMGGMSRRQAGEDFYFLQKIALTAPVSGIETPIVFPAPAISVRVPFGTGQAVKKIVETGKCKVYNFDLFLILKKFYSQFADLYTSDGVAVPSEILDFVTEEKFYQIVEECRRNTSDTKSFVKRLHAKFDVFFMIRFLNSFGESSTYPPVDIEIAANQLIDYYDVVRAGDLYDDIFALDVSVTN